MYQAIVFLPLIGAIIAALISLAGARARFPGGSPPAGAEDHAGPAVAEAHPRAAPSPYGAHAAADASHSEPDVREPAAAGSRMAEVATTSLLFFAMVLAWVALANAIMGRGDARIP